MDRLERLKGLPNYRRLEAAVITKPANIAAFFRGAQISLGFRQEPPGRVAICIRDKKITLLGNRVEVERVVKDELYWLKNLVIRPFRWDEWNLNSSVKAYLGSEGITKVCDDVGIFGENISTALEGLYYPLTEGEINSLRELAKNTAFIVETVAKNIIPEKTEIEVTGELTGQLVSRGIWPELTMVVADERIKNFRHAIPKKIPIRKIALLSTTVHQKGLYVSLTRLVSLGRINANWRQLQRACNQIDARAISLSRPGNSVGEIFRAIKKSYEEEGYAKEWQEHHQGGPAGFCGRDYKATEKEIRSLTEGQPVVWNPTVHGLKSEDTIITRERDQFPEILTESGNWSYYSVNIDGVIIRRPAILEK